VLLPAYAVILEAQKHLTTDYALKINLRAWFKNGVYRVRREIGLEPCAETQQLSRSIEGPPPT
jgi:hypothetical protein